VVIASSSLFAKSSHIERLKSIQARPHSRFPHRVRLQLAAATTTRTARTNNAATKSPFSLSPGKRTLSAALSSLGAGIVAFFCLRTGEWRLDSERGWPIAVGVWANFNLADVALFPLGSLAWNVSPPHFPALLFRHAWGRAFSLNLFLEILFLGGFVEGKRLPREYLRTD
jgi:hypothetical protein